MYPKEESFGVCITKSRRRVRKKEEEEGKVEGKKKRRNTKEKRKEKEEREVNLGEAWQTLLTALGTPAAGSTRLRSVLSGDL